jgi:hypothetical protein
LSNKFTEPDWDKLNALFAEHAQWANMSVTIKEITKENKSLIHDLSKYDPTVAVPLLASLLTLPKYQSPDPHYAARSNRTSTSRPSRAAA